MVSKRVRFEEALAMIVAAELVLTMGVLVLATSETAAPEHGMFKSVFSLFSRLVSILS